ncbi:hypothetical protein Cgig2_006971 [Carnegiea gigantea]|uniref:Uncharacterized protein n=1 Tax=Carnegiea gigantea TaxID=171969 RepID=A0A9Q1KD95_9CARY|nr:hypothetical protein Cgig2_006971 [Carnegiea gigantea]
MNVMITAQHLKWDQGFGSHFMDEYMEDMESRLSHSVTLQVSSFRGTATANWSLPRPEFSPVGGGIDSLSPLQFMVGLILSLADFSPVVSGSKNPMQSNLFDCEKMVQAIICTQDWLRLSSRLHIDDYLGELQDLDKDLDKLSVNDNVIDMGDTLNI